MSYTLYTILEIGLLALVAAAIAYAYREATREDAGDGGDETP